MSRIPGLYTYVKSVGPSGGLAALVPWQNSALYIIVSSNNANAGNLYILSTDSDTNDICIIEKIEMYSIGVSLTFEKTSDLMYITNTGSWGTRLKIIMLYKV